MKTSKSILLIEDDKDDQEFFIEALAGMENVTLFATAGNGKEAITQLKDSAILPDIIFTDLNMPVMNGVECFTELMKNPKTRHIPVVFLSSDTGRMEMVCELGAKAFLLKSSDKKTLCSQLEKVIGSDFMVNNYRNKISPPRIHRV